jgi:hypothetical protein
MLSRLISCRQSVCKVRLICVRISPLSPHVRVAAEGLFINKGVYAWFMHGFASGFSTHISSFCRLLKRNLYLLSTRPTNTTTSYLNLLNISYC